MSLASVLSTAAAAATTTLAVRKEGRAGMVQAEKTLVPWLGKEEGSERERNRGKEP